MTTTKTAKIAKPLGDKPGTPKKQKRFSFLRDLAKEMNRLTGRVWDPGYLSNLVTGIKINKGLEKDGTLSKAVANLAAKGITQSGKATT